MRKTLLGIAGTAVLLLAVTSPGFSQVNCGIIKKDLEAGRDPKDIAELKGISVSDVKKCQAEAGAAKAAAPEAGKPGAAAENPKSDKEMPVGSGGH